MLQDHYLEFRAHLHHLLAPLAVLILVSSIAVAPGDLRQALESYLRQFAASQGLRATLSYPDNLPCTPFTPAVEEQVLRIVQEALANVRKHAAATRVEVLFSFSDEQAQIIITDDGVGFRISDFGIAKPSRKAIRNPQSPIRNPQSPVTSAWP